VSWYQKGKINLDFTEARDSSGSGISSLQTDVSTPPATTQFFTDRPTNSVKALKALKKSVILCLGDLAV